MKLTAYLLLACGTQVFANANSQTVTLFSIKEPLQNVFKAIEQQTHYVVLIDNSLLLSSAPVTISAKDMALIEFLNILLNPQQMEYAIESKTIIVSKTRLPNITSQLSLPPVVTITGKVISDDGVPLAGAYVLVKGSSRGIYTDANGVFKLENLPEDAVLIVSFIGYKSKEIRVTNGDIKISLSRSIAIMDSISITTLSTGYQILPKERTTGSFTVIDNKLYNEQVGTSVLERLKYISNGIIPFPNRIGTTAQDQILIRGISTLTTTIQKPLIILDNFEYQGDINNLNPNDIEKVTFLKDAAAGSIWGAKAANGVIVITTKNARYQQKTKLEINSNVTIINKPNLFYLKNIASGDLIDVEQYLFNHQYRFSDTSKGTHPPFSPVYEILFKQQKGLLTSAQADSQINALRNSDVRNDFENYIYRKAVNQQYAVSMSGGADNINWIFSGGMDRNLSDLSSKLNRLNARFDNNYKPVKNLELSTSIYYTQTKNKVGKLGYGGINTTVGSLPGYTQLADVNGRALPVYTQYRQGYIDTLGSGKLLDWRYYPKDDYLHTNNTTSLQDMNMMFGLNYKILSYLTVDLKYRYEKQKSENRILYDPQSYFTRDLINGFSQLNYNTGSVAYKIPKGFIFDQFYNNTTAQNIRGQFNFNNSWGKSAVVAIAGGEVNEVVKETNLYRTYGYNPDILTYVNVDYTSSYPQFISGYTFFIPNPASFGKTNTRFLSYYANAAYTYNNKYTLSGSFRRDASNLFGLDINDKWKPLWSAGIGWDISKESHYPVSWLPFLKAKATYGHQGNIDPSKVAVTTFQSLGTSPYTSTPTSQVDNFINPDLKWEQVAMFNVGLDFATASRRISGSIEYYAKNITDLYGPVNIDPTTGLRTTSIIRNVGDMRGKGFDIEINTVNINKAFTWTSNIIFNRYKDKIKRYYDPATLQPSQLIDYGGRVQGYSPFALFAFKWAGLDPSTGDPQGYINGHLSKDWSSITGSGSTMQDIKYIGSRIPTIFGSIGNTIRWKGISISARITYKLNYYFQRESIHYSNLIGSLSGHSDYNRRWKKPGDEAFTKIPSFTYPTNSARDNFFRNAEVLATKGDNVRLQYINVCYNLGNIINQSSVLRQTEIYGVINNVGIIWRANKERLDPDYNFLPPSINIAIGVRTNL